MRTTLLVVSVLFTCVAIGAQSAATNSYTQKNLVSDLSGTAVSTDPNLVNPWGLSRPANSQVAENEWWSADEATGLTTLYEADGTVTPLVITIPPASGTGRGSPTGTVAIGTNFAFATLDGTISQWLATTGPPTAPPVNHKALPAAAQCANCHTTSATIKVNNSSRGASYSGLALASNAGKQTLYAAGPGGVEAYDTNFNRLTLSAGAFTDPNVPAGFTPYGIQAVGQSLYVTFAPPFPGTGGYVDAFDPTGKLLVTLQHGTWFNAPWGVAQAPANFGLFSHAVLIGNKGSGQIAAFNPTTGKFLGFLKDSTGKVIANPGLWAIAFGNGNVESGPTTTLYFTAGIQEYAHGLFGAITAN